MPKRAEPSPSRPLGAVIADAELRALAEHRSSALASVLVEVAGSDRAVDIARPGDAVIGRPPVIGVAVPSLSPDGREPTTGADLARITGQPARFLRAARAYVVEATGAQLVEIAALPAVSAIHANRRIGPAVARA